MKHGTTTEARPHAHLVALLGIFIALLAGLLAIRQGLSLLNALYAGGVGYAAIVTAAAVITPIALRRVLWISALYLGGLIAGVLLTTYSCSRVIRHLSRRAVIL